MTERSFEEALERLEVIVKDMEDASDLGLEAMIKNYEEGLELAKFCQAKLDEAELKIEELTSKEN